MDEARDFSPLDLATFAPFTKFYLMLQKVSHKLLQLQKLLTKLPSTSLWYILKRRVFKSVAEFYYHLTWVSRLSCRQSREITLFLSQFVLATLQLSVPWCLNTSGERSGFKSRR